MKFNPQIIAEANRQAELADQLAKQATRQSPEPEAQPRPILQDLPELVTKNPHDYVQIPNIQGLHGGNPVISRFELNGINNENYFATHEAVLRLGLYVPTPAIFMPHFTNVVKTYLANQNIFDAAGNPFTREEHEDIYKHLTENRKSVHGTIPGAWTWLNARFVRSLDFNSFRGIDLETIVGIKPDGTFNAKQEPLALCLESLGTHVFVDFSFNSQGLANIPALNQVYKQGKNLSFCSPEQDKVAIFYASSGGAIFGGDCNLSDAYSALGAFACAEFPKSQTLGGKS